jgi:non-canonical (house-cleaning) NTP pyrophosphatase
MKILGLSPGPEVGKILNDLMEKVTDNPHLNTERGLVGVLEEMKKG